MTTTSAAHSVREVISVCLVAVSLAGQIAIPLIRLWAPRPARFGWQMYSSVRFNPRFATVAIDGRVTGVRLADFLGNPRGDLDLTDDRIPAHLCAVIPGTRAIRVEAGGVPRDRPC